MNTQDQFNSKVRANTEIHNQPLNKSEQLWTVEDVAHYLQICPETVRLMARNQKLPAFKIGRMWRFKKSQLDTYLLDFIKNSL
jgi:excisionase family DNA binding protein